jgi:molybdenum cofactor cytidylyltransferase
MVSVSGVLLAAGSSERLGFPKQLIQIGKEPLIRRTARIALEVFPLTVILGYKSEECRAALAGLDLAILQNPNWQEGVASSIRLGVKKSDEAGAPAVLLIVVDQYRIETKILQTFAAEFNGETDRVIAAAYSGVLGTPVLFGSGWFQELLCLSGDQGARRLIKRANNLISVPWPDGAMDLDTVSDLQKFSSSNIPPVGNEQPIQ